MDTDALLQKARFMLHRCRAEGVEPLGWGMSQAMWLDLWAAQRTPMVATPPSGRSTLYGLPVDIDDVYTDLSIRII